MHDPHAEHFLTLVGMIYIKPQSCTSNACRHVHLAPACLGLRICMVLLSGLCSSGYCSLALVMAFPQCVYAPCFLSSSFHFCSASASL
ncbi:hypothetical protein ID866_12017 [Astraeus odoratus]|nr:hypothetical protein ID866_12017 [Astraeus odoratus]